MFAHYFSVLGASSWWTCILSEIFIWFLGFPNIGATWRCFKDLYSAGEPEIQIRFCCSRKNIWRISHKMSRIWHLKNYLWKMSQYMINVQWQTELLRERQHLLHSICNSSLDRSSWEFLVEVEQDKQKTDQKNKKISFYFSVGITNRNKINKKDEKDNWSPLSWTFVTKKNKK